MNAFLWVVTILCALTVLSKLAKAWSGTDASWSEMADAVVNGGLVVWGLCLLFR